MYIFKSKNSIVKHVGLLVIASLLNVNLFADEVYNGDVGTFASGSIVTTSMDVVHPTLGTISDAAEITINATVGDPDGTVSFDASNTNTTEEININIASANEIDMAARTTFDFLAAELPLGVVNPTLVFRDIDDNSDGITGSGSNEFCDRLEITATDTMGNPISVGDFSFAAGAAAGGGTSPTSAPITPLDGFTYVIEAITGANDGVGTGEIIVTVDNNNVAGIVVLYKACDKPDVDRPGAMGIELGISEFIVPTSSLIIQKKWVDAQVGDTTVVSTSSSVTPAVPDLNSVADTSAEVDTPAAVEVRAGFDYTISEVLGAANTGFYDSSVSCTGTEDTDLSDGVLTPAQADDTVECTLLNDGRVSDLSVEKTNNPISVDTYTPGDSFEYTVTVTNNGPDAVVNATVSDDVPDWGTGVTWTCAPAASCGVASGSGDLVNQVIGSLANGESIVYTIKGTYSTDDSVY